MFKVLAKSVPKPIGLMRFSNSKSNLLTLLLFEMAIPFSPVS